MTFTAVYMQVPEGYIAFVEELPGANTQGATMEEARENLAVIGAELDHRPGRSWRNLQDTADAVPALQDAPRAWQSWRRGVDYYDEDVLNWLWVDVLLRQQTGGKKTMDDFCHTFHGGSNTLPEVKTYTFDDVVKTLEGLAPYDWRKFWIERLTNHGPAAPLGGIEGSGWKLAYSDVPSGLTKAEEEDRDTVDSRYSVGLDLRGDGSVVDTIEGMPAAKAGIGPAMKILAVDGRKFTKNAWREALKAAKSSSMPMEVLVENSDYIKTFKVDYHEGEKFPHLERDAFKPDLLSEIYAAK